MAKGIFAAAAREIRGDRRTRDAAGSGGTDHRQRAAGEQHPTTCERAGRSRSSRAANATVAAGYIDTTTATTDSRSSRVDSR